MRPRAAQGWQVFTDDKAELAAAVERSGERVAASDMEGSATQGEAERKPLRARIMAKALE